MLALGYSLFLISSLLALWFYRRWRASERLLQGVLETVSSPLYYTDEHLLCIRCNEPMRLFACSITDSLEGRYFPELLSKESAAFKKETDEQLLKSGIPMAFFWEPVDSKGIKHRCLVHKRRWSPSKKRHGIICEIVDMESYLNLHEKNRHLDRYLAQQSKLAELGQILLAITHQWNKPIVDLSIDIQRLQKEYHQESLTPEKFADFARGSIQTLHHLSNTIGDFYSFIKPDFKKREFSPYEALLETIALLQGRFDYHFIQCHLRLIGKPKRLCGHKGLLKQALCTLLNNACDSIVESHSSSPASKGKIFVTLCFRGDSCQFIIRDNGLGVSEEKRERIFYPFFTTKPHGHGLGLSITKEFLLEKFNAPLTLLPPPKGGGARFEILLPMEG
ncbi:ATP-binding protein [Wolinella succinogenes]|uniref:ATP-binding protein n=1 Tax=Wolinella succinogenes TaxID=844 RepID=UPI002FC81082